MKAGVREVIITPDFPVLLAGFPEPKDRYSRGVHDDLKAHCFWLESEGEEYVIVTMDLLCYPKWLVREMRKHIDAVVGVSPEHCIISTTHTHSGPETRAVPFYPEQELQVMYPYYLQIIKEKVVGALKQAKESCFEAEIGVEKGYCGPEQNVGGNRRSKGGLVDTDVWVVGIRDKEKNIRGAIVRYSLHPTFLGTDNREITCDYPGYLYQTLKKKNPDMVTGFWIGTAGDQSSRFFRSGCTFEEAERVGSTIGQEALRILENMEFEDKLQFFSYRTEVMPVRKVIPSYEQALEDLRTSEEEFETAMLMQEDAGIIRTKECATIGAKRMLGLASIGAEKVYSLNGDHPFEVSLLKIGEWCIVTLPTETFVTYGLEIRDKSPYENTIVITCANGYGRGYICTPEAFEEGGYEALGSLYTGENGRLLVEAALSLLHKAKAMER